VTQIGIAQMAVWRLALQSNGGDYFDDPRRPKKSRLDEPRAIAGIEYIRDLTHKYRAGWRNEDAQRLGGNDINAYNTQKSAMVLRHGVHGRFPEVASVTGIVPFPKGPDAQGKPVTDLTTEAAGIMRASKSQDAAWQFCRWYHKDWQREILASATPMDARVASRSDLQDVARKALPPPVELWFDMAAQGLLSRGVNPDWDKMTRDIFNPGLNPVWAGERAAREAALDVSKQINDFLAANPQ
jgi:ABC-type glycerol-3-phosphate transport system substrate-binding protein